MEDLIAMERLIVKVERIEMYNLVWSKPMTEIAEEFGTSAVAIGKRCRSHGVPLPGVGYWQKKEAGKKVHKIPLPKFDGPQQLTFRVKMLGVEVSEPEAVCEAKLHERMPENKIVVGKSLRSPHRLVSTAKDLLERVATDTEKGHQVYTSEACLNIRVTRPCLNRALRIMDALIKALENRGASVELERSKRRTTDVIMGRERINIDLYEGFRYGEPKVNSGAWRQRDYNATGELILRIESATYMDCRHLWRDGKRVKLEEQLNDFVVGLRIVAEMERQSRIRHEENARKWQEEERVREEIRRKKQEELDRIEKLDREIANWRKASEIRAYVEAVRLSGKALDGAMTSDSDGETWLEWALEQAERIDPLRRIQTL